jgi:F0F1-type ATP synthase assembly protein I
MATQIIAITGFFITMIVFISSYFRTRHNERMALIKNEKTATIFNVEKGDSNGALKLGLLMLSIGLGLLIGLILDGIFDTEPAGVFVSMLILGGLSLIFYHSYIERKDSPKTNNHDELV